MCNPTPPHEVQQTTRLPYCCVAITDSVSLAFKAFNMIIVLLLLYRVAISDSLSLAALFKVLTYVRGVYDLTFARCCTGRGHRALVYGLRLLPGIFLSPVGLSTSYARQLSSNFACTHAERLEFYLRSSNFLSRVSTITTIDVVFRSSPQ